MLHVTSENAEGEKFKAEADEAIANFDRYFQSLPNEPLSGPEKAILSTFIWYMIKVRGSADAVSPGPNQG